MPEIRGDAKSVRGLLGTSKYAVDYFQREYRWQTKHVTELIDDLASKFAASYDPTDPRSAVSQYGHYFLGSIIISEKEGKKFLIDGQQRLTSLTLLLIFLSRSIHDSDQKAQVNDLIFSQRYGERSFNLDIPERAACMEALYSGEVLDDSGRAESVRNILARFDDIGENFPEGMKDEALPFFVDWLIENVYLVEITAYSDEDAYTIFETMNDRGLSLTPTEMLKGHLLASIGNTQLRTDAGNVWKHRIDSLIQLGKEEDADAIKAWLRGQHCDSIRERKAGALPQDWDLIGTEFHRWVRENEAKLNLQAGPEFAQWIQRDFKFYTGWYSRLRQATVKLTPGLETVYYNGQYNFTLQYPVMLAAIQIDDPEEAILEKIRVVASFIDILIARRVWNWRAVDYSTLQYAMFVVSKEIRGREPGSIADVLLTRLSEESQDFSANDRFSLHGMNRRPIQRMLARMTDYVEVGAGRPSHYLDYVSAAGKKGYEVEHIWADHAERHTEDFSHPSDFDEYRNRIGDLLLLPKDFNASYGDLPYGEKREFYLQQNLLAKSLHEQAYSHNPGFVRFIRDSGLAFEPIAHFDKVALDSRQHLYAALAERIWSPSRLNVAEASSS